MASRIISETTKTRKGTAGLGKRTNTKKHAGDRQKTDHRTAEDKRVDDEKWLHRERYDELVASGILTGHKGNTSGDIRSNYWPHKVGLQPDEAGNPLKNAYTAQTSTMTSGAAVQQEEDTIINDVEALRMLWIKDDTSWNTSEVFGEHRKKLRPFSEDYKNRKIKLLGHVIRADNEDPMRKVTFLPNTIEEWGFAHRRVGRPKDQWLHETKKLVWEKCRHMEDRQGYAKPDKRTKYKGKTLQETYIHTWAEDRCF